ncbi:hypothetical protein LCGC14_2420710 [marine sediment metagenome]|uniref:Uncharacterized protein n=1 Tax=marine sediment metagenome TaxID=412755 RepID=A0A0F9E1T1_9ZZZZ
MKQVKIPIHAIHWIDACHAFEPSQMNTTLSAAIDIGYILERHKDRIILIRQIFDYGKCRHTMVIPNKGIVKIIKVGVLTLPEGFIKIIPINEA